MTTEYILTTTPREIAAAHTLEEIEREIRHEVIEELDIDELIGSFSWTEFYDRLPDMRGCANDIAEWFEEVEEAERPTVEQLAIAYQLGAARACRMEMDEDA